MIAELAEDFAGAGPDPVIVCGVNVAVGVINDVPVVWPILLAASDGEGPTIAPSEAFQETSTLSVRCCRWR